MPSENFHQLTIAQFAEMVERYPFQRQINEVHMHHTYIPARVDYRGLETIVGMWKYHTTPAPKGRGWSDIAQHVTIAPNGTIWTGRPWNRPPASAYGFNGSSSLGPFMFETIGNFDIGHDRLEGAQLDSVIAVIALIQLHAGIAADKLRFHNEMTNEKTCPGTGVKHTDILGLVARYHKAQAKPRDLASPPLRMPDDRLVTRALLEQFSRDGSTRAAGTMEDELPEGGMTFAQRQGAYEALDTSDHTRGGARDAARAGLTPEEIAALAPHVINLNQGELSRGGAVQTSVADVARIFDEHIPQFLAALIAADQAPNLRIMFFAHGGLVGEMSGLAVAHKGVEWWKKNGVYPIYFVWETGLCETLGQIFDKVLRLTGVRRGDRGILDGIASVGSAIGDKLVDHVTDNLIAEIAHDVGGVSVWGEMKSNARHANQPLGGASVVVSNLQRFLKTPPAGANITLHAVGHSAGAIFHSYFVPLVHAETGRTFQTVDFLAPAVRVDEFKQTLWPMVRPVAAAAKPAAADAKAVAADRLTIYTMHDALERADNCGPYRKSLLYTSMTDSSPIATNQSSVSSGP